MEWVLAKDIQQLDDVTYQVEIYDYIVNTQEGGQSITITKNENVSQPDADSETSDAEPGANAEGKTEEPATTEPAVKTAE